MKFVNLAIIILSVLLSAGQARAVTRLVNSRAEHIRSLIDAYKAHRSQTYVHPSCTSTYVPTFQAPVREERHRPYHYTPQSDASKNELFAIVAREASKVGVHPVVMYSIEVHESANYRSALWRQGFNPGGIEYRSFVGINCWRNPNKPRWAAFGSAEDGIRAHAFVLANRRYDGARSTSDPYVQVECIGNAGYCEKPWRKGWLSGIKSNVRRFIGLFSSKPKEKRPEPLLL